MKPLIELAGGDAVLVEHIEKSLTVTERFVDKDHPLAYTDLPGDTPYERWVGEGPEPCEYVEDFQRAKEQGLYDEIPWSVAMDEAISERLLAAMVERTGKKRPNSEVARRMGCDDKTLGAYAKAPRMMTRAFAVALCITLDVSPHWVRYGDEKCVMDPKDPEPEFLSMESVSRKVALLNYENRLAVSRLINALLEHQNITDIMASRGRAHPMRPELASMKSRSDWDWAAEYWDRFLATHNAEIFF